MLAAVWTARSCCPRRCRQGDLVIHEVLADEPSGYMRHDEVRAAGAGLARDCGLWLSLDDAAMIVERLPGRAAFPRQHGPARLFTLAPGQIGRYRANFRFTGCACNPSWFYEEWVVHVSNGQVEPDRFIQGAPDRDIDDRVHLYGGTTRPGGYSHRQQARLTR
ncbi:hypothetical protein GCM10010170_024830 [Dactylosporangium salmoneum]|uniref:Uncharacterized protein n=1 Tax=Dactylosporangium salmoneum TaxID=53361 RepID=A0ABN3G041_9ACTN